MRLSPQSLTTHLDLVILRVVFDKTTHSVIKVNSAKRNWVTVMGLEPANRLPHLMKYAR